jgi:hypothetical protein
MGSIVSVAAMPVVSRDVIWPLSQIRVISSEFAKPARATATPAVHVGVVTRGPLSEADLDRGKTWS